VTDRGRRRRRRMRGVGGAEGEMEGGDRVEGESEKRVEKKLREVEERVERAKLRIGRRRRGIGS
jgi:hypothetical protein